MKDHKERSESVDMWSLEGTVDEVVEYLHHLADGKVDPRIVIDWGYEDMNFHLVHQVPLTDKEKRAARERNAKARKAQKERDERAKAAAETADRETYERLRRKYG